MRFANADKIARWDDFIEANPAAGAVWQGRKYAEHERALGFIPIYLFVGDLACMVLERRIPLLGRTWHLPGAPRVVDIESAFAVASALAPFAAAQGVATVRIEPRVPDDASARYLLHAAGYRQVQVWAPRHTVIVDLGGTEEQVLARFGQRARRWIGRAARDGVAVERVEATEENCRNFYELFAATADRRFPIRSFEHVHSLYSRLQKAGNGQLFIARLGDEVVAGAFVMRVGGEAMYLNGASIRKEAGLSGENGLGAHGVGHAVQWEAMRWAREVGAVRYDFGGTPLSAQADDPAHPLCGVGQFKLSFCKSIVDYIGTYDVPARPIRSRLLYEYERMILAAAESPTFRRFVS
ncbi:lipid II:glycine glycyltransferase FemX [Rhodococcus chondri]|uniref:Peptidoglycan bridge formation glycyltransferase FemA/FemB family protein n=1 Tax=Rhodococcus chondri TaxID=3065941 RepID=A0ABU7JX32_9NOCA|nr:peptidoglycan bridge formation glycyltransferase FemA/FemB family protein [Rhodococcus sp. CC-R104]MEE2034578.1 peptidoglycan bridge formation glycyltransferase FemA/FemB family protein [Rhodococcus sp. CC-R104]